MGAYTIIAGKEDQINRKCGDWLIIDIGMSSTRKTCGVWCDPDTFKSMHFQELRDFLTYTAKIANRGPLNLTIEAPLSVAFRPNGNPWYRRCDKYKPNPKKNHESKHWNQNGGRATILAAQFLLRELHESKTRRRNIRLFEGHIAFKRYINYKPFEIQKNPHLKDVLVLKNAIFNENERDIFILTNLRDNRSPIFESPFPFFPKTLIPPVIRPKLSPKNLPSPTNAS